MSSIVTSQLNNDTASLSGEDFFPLVSSSSVTSYKVSFETIKEFFSLPQISCSFSNHDDSSSYALSASYPPYPQISASWVSRSFSSSYAITASWAPHSPQIFFISMSYASRSLSASYALSASWAPQSAQVFQPTCSWVSQSFSASHAITASWAPNLNVNSAINFVYTSSVNIPQTRPQIYIIPSSVPFTYGVILDIAGDEGVYDVSYISSSVMSLITVGGGGHGDNLSTFYANISTNDRKLYITGSATSMSLVGYY